MPASRARSAWWFAAGCACGVLAVGAASLLHWLYGDPDPQERYG